MFEETNENQVAEGAETAEQSGPESKPRFRVSRSTGMLGILVAAAVGGLWFMHWKSGPATAVADTTAQKAIKNFLGDGKKEVDSMKATLANTERQVAELRQFPAASQVPLEDLRRNPFAEKTTDAKSPVATSKFSEAERDAALKKASALKLKSIIYSESSRSCIINNRFCQEGTSIDGFTIERISQSSVIVKSEAFRFELKVAR
jgi:hypothetical protein